MSQSPIPPLPPLAFLSELSQLRGAVERLTDRAWTPEEQAEGRHVYAGCTKTDWPHFKAYFELLGWEVTPVGVVEHSGYVPNAVIRAPI